MLGWRVEGPYHYAFMCGHNLIHQTLLQTTVLVLVCLFCLVFFSPFAKYTPMSNYLYRIDLKKTLKKNFLFLKMEEENNKN